VGRRARPLPRRLAPQRVTMPAQQPARRLAGGARGRYTTGFRSIAAADEAVRRESISCSSLVGCNMPNTVSAKKAMRQNIKRRLQNRSQTAALRTAVKKVRKLSEAKDAAGAAEALREATKRLDQAADKHLIHKNTAGRTKSRLAKLVASISQ